MINKLLINNKKNFINNKKIIKYYLSSTSSSKPTENKLWGGRFDESVDPMMEKFNCSLTYDKRMFKEDIEGSIAYAETLELANILKNDEVLKIKDGFKIVLDEWENNKFDIQSSDEDIHTANERRLTEIIGSDIGGKLHTGRSRNDQVATDVRLWLRNQIDDLLNDLLLLLKITNERAKNDIDIMMPGYTHLQPAQPILFSHWLLAYASNFKRDYQRLLQVRERVNVMPLGSGAIAGHPFFNPDHRQILKEKLKFEDVTTNSMDATSDRDFIIDFLYWSSLTSIHLSRWSEDIIIYSSNEFSFIKLSDKYSTGSSLMPVSYKFFNKTTII